MSIEAQIEEARGEHREAHERFVAHYTRCRDCDGGYLCPVAQRLDQDADDAGKRLTQAEGEAQRICSCRRRQLAPAVA